MMFYDFWQKFSLRIMNLIGYNIVLKRMLYTREGIFIFNYLTFIPEKVYLYINYYYFYTLKGIIRWNKFQ